MNRDSSHPVFRDLRRALGREPNRRVWNYLVEQGFVDDAEAIPAGLNDLLDDYARLEKAFISNGRRTRGSFDHETVLLRARDRFFDVFDTENKALEMMTAVIIEELVTVQEFRDVYLGGQVLDPTDVPEWLDSLDTNLGPTRRRVRAFLNDDGTIDKDSIVPDISSQDKFPIGYKEPGDDKWKFRYVDVESNDVLQKLWAITDTIYLSVGWERDHTATLILTGLLQPSMIPLGLVDIGNNYHRIAGHATVTLRFNLGLTPTQVGDIYSFFREVAAEKPRRRYSFNRDRMTKRTMRERSVHLASVTSSAVLYGENADWPHYLEYWNELWKDARPDWCYRPVDQMGNFKRDARNAFERVLGTDAEGVWQWLQQVNDGHLGSTSET